MTNVARLQKEALISCNNRGHKMGRFNQIDLTNGSRIYRAECKDCGAWVDVNPKPAPNEIDIGGTAVALNCTTDNT